MLPDRHHDVSRLEAFSDAAFAFALTLLVISLEVPRSYADLMRTMYGLPSFACCFALLVWIWHEHNMFFRRYGLRDGWTVVLNAGLLFITLFYVYPLKFMFDSLFAELGAAQGLQRMSLGQLSRVSAIYGFGFLAVFLMFALLYRRAYQQRDRLQLTALELFDVVTFTRHHLISAGVGLLSIVVALLLPTRLAPLAPITFGLMGPLHWRYGVGRLRKRQALATTRLDR